MLGFVVQSKVPILATLKTFRQPGGVGEGQFLGCIDNTEGQMLACDVLEPIPRLMGVIRDQRRDSRIGSALQLLMEPFCHVEMHLLGQLQPNNAESGIPQKFTYTLTAQPVQGDGGFNLIRLQTPAQADAEKLVIRVEGVEVDPVSVEVQLYSLVLQLPDVVREQNVEVDFEVSVVKNPYEFIASIGHTDTPELWQVTEPSERYATSVFLDGVAENQHLIGNLSVEPVVVTPNGDDIGDKVNIRFSVLKVETPAVVRIYSLNGNLVQELPCDGPYYA